MGSLSRTTWDRDGTLTFQTTELFELEKTRAAKSLMSLNLNVYIYIYTYFLS
jgi:hypothetical protein